MKIETHDFQDVKDRASEVADRAISVAKDVVNDAGNAAKDFVRDTGESAKDFGKDAQENARDGGKELGSNLEKGSKELGSDIEHGARELGSAVGQKLDKGSKQAAKELEKAAKQAAKDARKAGRQARSAVSDFRGEVGNGFDHASAAAGHLASDLRDGAREGARRWSRLPKLIGDAVEPVQEDTRRRFGGLKAALGAGAFQLGVNLAKRAGRAILPQRPSAIARIAPAIPVGAVVIMAAGTGAVLMYAFDPVAGPRRRAQARQQVVSGVRDIRRRIGGATSFVAARIGQMRDSGSDTAEIQATRSTSTRAPRKVETAAVPKLAATAAS